MGLGGMHSYPHMPLLARREVMSWRRIEAPSSGPLFGLGLGHQGAVFVGCVRGRLVPGSGVLLPFWDKGDEPAVLAGIHGRIVESTPTWQCEITAVFVFDGLAVDTGSKR